MPRLLALMTALVALSSPSFAACPFPDRRRSTFKVTAKVSSLMPNAAKIEVVCAVGHVKDLHDVPTVPFVSPPGLSRQFGPDLPGAIATRKVVPRRRCEFDRRRLPQCRHRSEQQVEGDRLDRAIAWRVPTSIAASWRCGRRATNISNLIHIVARSPQPVQDAGGGTAENGRAVSAVGARLYPPK